MADGNYDNTNSGVFFQPHPDQKLFGQGRLNIEGRDHRIVVVREKLSRDGDTLPVVYVRLGPLFGNKSDNENAPHWSGPMDDYPHLRMAGWRREKDGRKYVSMRVSEKQKRDSSGGSVTEAQDDGWGGDGFDDDMIPF